jgi:hypothetical protein
VSDVLTIETADFVKIGIRVSYSVTFIPEHKAKWWNHENYIQFICDHLRSIVRSRCRTLSLSALWPQIPALVRDTILGERTAGGRPGRTFAENGTVVTEVEVLSSTIEDPKISELMRRAQGEAVTLQIGDRQAQEALASAKLRSDLERQQQELQAAAREREAKLKEQVRRLAAEGALAEARDAETLAREKQQLIDQREATRVAAQIERTGQIKAAELELLAKETEAKAAAERTLTDARLVEKRALHGLEVELVKTHSTATVAERQAVQAGLVEALTGLGDKVLLSEVAQNMNLVSLFKGKDVGSILQDVVGGTSAVRTVKALADKYGTTSTAASPPGS